MFYLGGGRQWNKSGGNSCFKTPQFTQCYAGSFAAGGGGQVTPPLVPFQVQYHPTIFPPRLWGQGLLHTLWSTTCFSKLPPTPTSIPHTLICINLVVGPETRTKNEEEAAVCYAKRSLPCWDVRANSDLHKK